MRQFLLPYVIFYFLLFHASFMTARITYTPNIMVDAAGRGHFSTVQQAVDHAPTYSSRKFVIGVKQGNYTGKVVIGPDKPNLVLLGEGARRTHILWNDHAANSSTLDSATVKVFASNFLAIGISFHNFYVPVTGPSDNGNQAVALMISGDMGAFYRCSFYGFQDTLFDAQGRHYFKECFIQGSVDFIFGDGQSYYESCIIDSIDTQWPGSSIPGIIAAQAREKPTDPSGFSFVRCQVNGNGRAYLGRPWGDYSRVVFSHSYLSTVVVPQGWENWQRSRRYRTAYYGEFNNIGPGINRARRVPWSKALTEHQAQQFTSPEFVQASRWLPPLG